MNLLLKTTTNRSLAKPLRTRIATALIIGVTTANPLPSFAQSNSKQIWYCQAENQTRYYVVNRLDLNNPEFDMEIQSKEQGDDRNYIRNYIGTIPIKIDETRSDYVGTGRTYNSRITVSAFGRTADFRVDDSRTGSAFGRCWVNGKEAAFNPPNTRPQPSTEDEQEILAMIAAENQKYPREVAREVTKLVTSQSYGLYRWVMGERSGQTVVRKGSNGVWTSWTLRKGNSGAEDIERLQKWGVPKPIALDLVSKINN